jgi:hypothetical protein
VQNHAGLGVAPQAQKAFMFQRLFAISTSELFLTNTPFLVMAGFVQAYGKAS